MVLFPGSVLPLRLSDRRWVNYLRNLINDARGLYGLHSSSIGGMGEVRIVILPKSDSTRRTRRQPREGGGRTGRWQVGLIRRGVTGMRRRLRRRMLRESEEADTNNEAAEEDIDGNRQEEHNEHNRESEQSDEEDSEDDIFHPSDRPLSTIPCDDDPLVGRIGTLATITFTHEDTATSVNTDQAVAVGNEDTTTSSRVWHNRGDELVLTVLGTKRVRLIRSMRDKIRDQSTSVPLYEVEEIRDEGTIPPPLWMLQYLGIRSPVTTRAFIESNVSREQKEEGDKSEEEVVGITKYDIKAIQSLSSLTSLPTFAYQTIWPWKLCRKICRLIQDTEEFTGLCEILQSAAGLLYDDSNTETQEIPFQVVDPSAFSDWLACLKELPITCLKQSKSSLRNKPRAGIGAQFITVEIASGLINARFQLNNDVTLATKEFVGTCKQPATALIGKHAEYAYSSDIHGERRRPSSNTRAQRCPIASSSPGPPLRVSFPGPLRSTSFCFPPTKKSPPIPPNRLSSPELP